MATVGGGRWAVESEICGLPTPHYSELDRQSWCTQGRRAEGDRRWRSNDLSLGYGASHITRPRVWPPIHVDGSLASRRQAAPAVRALSSPLGSPPMGRLSRPTPQRACREAPEGVCGRTPIRSVVSVGAVRCAPEKARHGAERQRHDSGDGAADLSQNVCDSLQHSGLSSIRSREELAFLACPAHLSSFMGRSRAFLVYPALSAARNAGVS